MISNAEIAYALWMARKEKVHMNLETGMPWDEGTCNAAIAKIHPIIMNEWAQLEYEQRNMKLVN